MDVLSTIIASNSIKEYLIAAGIFVSVFFALKLVRYILIAVLRTLFTKIEVEIGNLIMRIITRLRGPLFLVISAFTAAQFLRIPRLAQTALEYFLMIVVIIYIILSLHFVVDYVIHHLIVKKEAEEQEIDTPIIYLLGIIAKISLWIIAFIFILSNMGYNVATLLAGFGIGGLVIAFGLQKVMQDLFASFSIYIDRPFVPGDFIIVGDDLGVVKKIGIKSTRIQHLGGQELVISNRELTDTRIHNYMRMERRRIAFTFGVTYQTSAEKLKRIPDMIKQIIGSVETAEVDRVHFKQYGDFSLVFEVVYYVITNDYAVYMDTQQKINLAMKERFQKEGIEFAYPTQTLFLRKRNQNQD